MIFDVISSSVTVSLEGVSDILSVDIVELGERTSPSVNDYLPICVVYRPSVASGLCSVNEIENIFLLFYFF